MSATVALFVFRVDFLLQECEVLLPISLNVLKSRAGVSP